jgi:hypothetical protein
LNRMYPSQKHTKAFDYVFFAYQNFYLAYTNLNKTYLLMTLVIFTFV